MKRPSPTRARIALMACMAGASLLALTPGSADAGPQKVFRCGPDGRIYSQTPCKEGDGYEVNAVDKRTPEQRKDADAAAKREAASVEKLRQERLAQERAAAQPGSAAKPVAATAPSASGAANKKLRGPAKASDQP